ncbi:hypothetical protein RJ641_011013, partial [Dillenia turbinata]
GSASLKLSEFPIEISRSLVCRWDYSALFARSREKRKKCESSWCMLSLSLSLS